VVEAVPAEPTDVPQLKAGLPWKVVASVVPVNDVAVVPLMAALHGRLRRCASLAEALRDAQQGPGSEPTAAAGGRSSRSAG
jgi:hypothetical protein